MYIIYVKTIFRVYKKPYTGFTWSLGATNGINYWIFILGSGQVDPGRTQVRHWTHWLTQGLTLGQMVLSSWPDPIWPGQLGSGRRSTRVKRVLTWPAATLVLRLKCSAVSTLRALFFLLPVIQQKTYAYITSSTIILHWPKATCAILSLHLTTHITHMSIPLRVFIDFGKATSQSTSHLHKTASPHLAHFQLFTSQRSWMP